MGYAKTAAKIATECTSHELRTHVDADRAWIARALTPGGAQRLRPANVENNI
jgi:hypothetical protein